MTPTFPCQLKQSVGVRDSRSPPLYLRERSWNGWAGAGGGGWVRNHKPTTSAGNRMRFICICSCMIHQHHFTRVQNIPFILQMLIYDKQLIRETSEPGSIKDPVTFTSLCLRQHARWGLGMSHVRIGVGTVCLAAAAVIFTSRWNLNSCQNYYRATK